MGEIAVIVPVYKAEAHLKRCVDSILSQTYSNLRLILVDDGSPDRSPEICDIYAAMDSRVYVIHQENGGPSSARNHGIDWAMENTECTYLSFIDSDDCVHPSFFQRFYDAVQTTGAGAAMCAHQYINQNETIVEAQVPSVSVRLLKPEDLMIEQSASFNYPWGKLFPRASFETLRYPEDVSFGEDNLIIYKALFGCETIAFLEEKLYYYFYNAEGITKSPWSERSLQVFWGIEAQMEYYKANGYERAYQKEAELYIQQCAYQIHRIREDRSNYSQNQHYLKMLTKKMRNFLKTRDGFALKDNNYWYEALHPVPAKVKRIIKRFINKVRRAFSA